jgi:hypothetical protein
MKHSMVRLRGGMSSLADTLAILTPTPPPPWLVVWHIRSSSRVAVG